MFDLKRDVEELTDAAGFHAVLKAYTELFEEYAKSFDDDDEKLSTERAAKSVRAALDELTKAGI